MACLKKEEKPWSPGIFIFLFFKKKNCDDVCRVRGFGQLSFLMKGEIWAARHTYRIWLCNWGSRAEIYLYLLFFSFNQNSIWDGSKHPRKKAEGNMSRSVRNVT